MRARLPLILALLLTAAAPARAQNAAAAPGPQGPRIHTSAQATVTVPAASAHLVIGATATSNRASDAGAQVAEVVNTIRDALVRIGFDRDKLPSAGYSVTPEIDRNQPRRYTAVSSIAVDVADLSRLGLVIDTALGAGATDVSRVTFEAADPAAAREKAIDEAFAKARTDAEALARAAGRSLGPPVLLSTDQSLRPFIQPMTIQRASSGTELPAPDVTVSASVSVDWQLD
jgi:uncharacterized protein